MSFDALHSGHKLFFKFKTNFSVLLLVSMSTICYGVNKTSKPAMSVSHLTTYKSGFENQKIDSPLLCVKIEKTTFILTIQKLAHLGHLLLPSPQVNMWRNIKLKLSTFSPSQSPIAIVYLITDRRCPANTNLKTQ